MTPLAFVRRKASGFARLSLAEQLLVMEASACLAFARVWLLVRPFRLIAAKLGEAKPAGWGANAQAQLDPAHEAAARKVSVAIERASKNVPIRAVCIQQAIGSKLMLSRRRVPCVIHFGVEKSNEPGEAIRAHAWVDVTNIPVSGYPIGAAMKEIACFV